MGFWLTVAALLLGGVALLFTFESPPIDTVQRGYRGLGMEQVYNRLALADKASATDIPQPQPATDPAGQPASAVYQNVQVLGNLDANEFLRLMAAMTEWVSPDNGQEGQGCAYCHNLENMADDTKYTHRVSRRMIQMTQHINANWKNHVGDTGVTCYTCHRGLNVPANIWFLDQGNRRPDMGSVGNNAGQNRASSASGYASLPFDPFQPFLQGDREIRVVGQAALPEGNRRSIKQTEWTYSLMMHMSRSLGVNCTYCHNTRSFMSWDQSAIQRTSSWYGIRMMRDLNAAYLDPLQPVYPPHRLGLQGDAPKANCTTCHQGAYKPLFGASMLKDYQAALGGGAPRRAGLDGKPLMGQSRVAGFTGSN